MRHLGSLIAGVLIAPLAWLLVAIGEEQSSSTVDGWVRAGAYHATDLVKAACLLAVAGILVGLIASLRLSPLGPLVAGIFYAGMYLALFVRPFQVRRAVPGHWTVFGQTIHPRVPLDNGTLLLLGALLLVAVVSVGRWRGRRAAPAADEQAADSTSSGSTSTGTTLSGDYTDTLTAPTSGRPGAGDNAGTPAFGG